MGRGNEQSVGMQMRTSFGRHTRVAHEAAADPKAVAADLTTAHHAAHEHALLGQALTSARRAWKTDLPEERRQLLITSQEHLATFGRDNGFAGQFVIAERDNRGALIEAGDILYQPADQRIEPTRLTFPDDMQPNELAERLAEARQREARLARQ